MPFVQFIKDKVSGGLDPDQIRRIAGAALLFAALILALTLPVSGPLRVGSRELVFLQSWEDELPPGFLEALLKEFEELNPGVTVVSDNRPYTEIRDLLQNAPPESFPADIFVIDPRWLAEKTVRERLEPLAESLSRPLFSSIITLFYNTELLENAGFDRPPKTQGDFERLAGELSSQEGIYALSMSLACGPQSDVYPWFWAAGQRLFSPEAGENLNFTSRPSVAVLQYLQNLYIQGFIAPGSTDKTASDKLEDFRTGRAAMIVAPIQAARKLRASSESVPFDISTVPGPASYVGKPYYGLKRCHAALSKESRFKAEGRALIAFLAEHASALAEAAGAVPGDTERGSYTGKDPLALKAYSIYEAGESPDEPGPPGSAALDSIVTDELLLLFSGEKSPEEAAAAIMRRWELAKSTTSP
jgi:multiple sugar transport system substrate-binding protein